ncbi:MAG TPA: hypothetical protein ENJ95_07265 [Bacteroidetes bacterium]|nr:hypothetical protein [Bacteroidota bacterium]
MRHILLTGLLGLFCIQLFATTIYVKANGTGTGTSWSNAAGDLAAVLLNAQPGDQVWVARGTYYPTKDRNRSICFTVPTGVKVFGGFAGNESSTQQRNIQSNKTILSGNIGSKSDPKDNSFTVIFFKNANANNQLDGFTIADGNANGAGPSGDKERCGGGLYLKGSKDKNAQPIIQSCVFQNNFARDGGAVYVNGRRGECSPVFSNCKFLHNSANLDGGAIFNDGRHDGKANPSFTNCTFTGNKGNYGGAICNYGGQGESSPKIYSCTFTNNEAFLRGGAIFNMDIDGETKPIVNDCQFVDNKAVAGKGMYTFSKYKEKQEGSVNSVAKMN